MNSKKYAVFGILSGVLAVVLGVVIMCGLFGGDTYSGGSGAPYSYDSGYATFGADFYTIVTNNAEEAAEAGRTVARNLDEIAKLLKYSLGCILIISGLFMICHFGMEHAKIKEAEYYTAHYQATETSNSYDVSSDLQDDPPVFRDNAESDY